MRIVSINLCTDELLLQLADREQIKSVTWLVKDPDISWDAPLARGIDANYGLVEEVVPLEPDLVLTGTMSTRSAVAMLKRLKLPVIELPPPFSLDDVRAQIRIVADAVGHSARGTALIAQMNKRLSNLNVSTAGLAALLYRPNGGAAGVGSLADEMMSAAGLENRAAKWSLDHYGHYPLELLVLDKPDILILNNQYDSPPSVANEILNHPALNKTFEPFETVIMPPQAWSCGTPHVVDAIEILLDAANRVARRRGNTST